MSPDRQLRLRSARTTGSPEAPAFDPSIHRVAVVQQLLVSGGVLDLHGAARDLIAFNGPGHDQLAAVTDAGLQVWRSHPLGGLTSTLSLGGVDYQGLVATRRGFLAFGPDGLRAFQAGDAPRTRRH